MITSSYIIMIITGLVAGFLSGAVGFGGGMIIIPVLSYFYGVEVAVPVSTIAQLLSNMSKMVIGFKSIKWSKVLQFLILAAPLTALGSFGFAVVPKQLMTQILCIFLIAFAVIKLTGKMHLPQNRTTVIAGGGITGLINGLLGISGPLSSAVFLTFGLTPVSYIASEATTATAMHLIKIFMYGKLNLIDCYSMLNGLYIGVAMMAGNYVALKTIRNINKKIYQKIVVAVMIVISIWLFFSA